MTIIRVLAAAWMFFAAAAPAAEADPPAVVGRLNHVAGAVSFAPAQAPEDWVAASVNRPITTGDRLWVDAGGRAEMHVGSLAVRMDSQTSMDVLNLDDRSLQLRLAQGSTNVRLRRAAGGEPVEIATPNGAVVLERPGSYRVNVDPRGSVTSVTVRGGGQAEVFEANGSFLVNDGQQASLSGQRQDLAGAPAPDEFDRWAATRDRREDSVASTRYVPAEMTGYEDLDEYGSWRTVPQYGAVWQPTTVPAGWAPYRQGHWVWVAPWGWTWVDDAPWGFAPSHYGRWVWLGGRWAWTPGRMVARPVYAPALVAFLGGSNFSVSIGAGSTPAVGWVPLGWREPYRPWYRASRAHLRDVNVTNVTNVTNINTVTNIRYVNRSAPSGVTVVSRENFAAARPVQAAALRVPARTIAAVPVTMGSPVATPARASLAQARTGARPPAEVRTREAVAVSAPPAPARAALREGGNNRGPARLAAAEERPRVRVIDRRERVNPAQAGPQRAAERQAQPGPQPESASVRERAAEKAPQPQAARPGERRAPAPPAEVTARPTFDRSSRTQVAPQADNRPAPPAAQDSQRIRQQAEQRATEQQGQDQARRERESQRQQAESGKDEQRRRSQERQAVGASREQVRQEQARERPQDQAQAQQRAQQQAQQPAQDQARQQQAREQDRQRGGQQAEQQARQRAQEQAERQQQAREQAQQRSQREAQQRTQEQARQQQQAQQRAQEQAQQQGRERAQEQAQQRAAQQHAQQQAQQQAREQARQQQAQQQQAQRAQQQAQQQARQQQAQQAQQQQAQHAQQQAQQQAQRAQQHAQQEQARQQRREQSQEKGGRERPHAEKGEKEKG